MNALGLILIGIGFFLIAGIAGSSDFYEICRVSPDCEAEPVTALRIVVQSTIALILIALGGFAISERKN